MTTPRQNQAKEGPPLNVLHDEGIPNTLGGLGPPTTPVRLRPPVGVFVAAVVVIVIVVVLLAARLA